MIKNYGFIDSHGNPRLSANSKGKRRVPGTKSLASILKHCDSAFIDFIDKCLAWNPKRRLSPEEALSHQWIVKKEKNFFR